MNKLDLLDWSAERFAEIVAEYREFAAQLGVADPMCIPMSALTGDNVTAPSERMPWYNGPPLLSYLEEVEPEDVAEGAPLRLPVQYVNRPDLDFRGFSGLVVRGAVAVGQAVCVLPSGCVARWPGS